MMYKLRFEKRDSFSMYQRILVVIFSILLALLACAVMMWAMGYNPIAAYKKLFIGSFGTKYGISESILQAIPLMLCALGISISYKMSINNIGAEGQYTMGAFAATGIALFARDLPKETVLPMMFILGFIAGMIWAVIAVIPKAFWDVSEIIITLMFNYIAMLWVDHWVYGAWRDVKGSNLPFTETFPEYARLTTYFNTRVNSGLIVAIIAAILIYFFFSRTNLGYQIRVIGSCPKAAHYAGMNVKKNILFVMALSGGLAGLAGVTQVAGPVGLLTPKIAQGAGYTAIIIAYLSKFNPFVVLISSILFGGLLQGGYSIQLLNIPSQIVTMIQGAILLFVLGGEIFTRKKLTIRKIELEEGKA